MLSDVCHQLVLELLEAITDWTYSDDYKSKLIKAIMKLNEIQDELDKNGEDGGVRLLKNDRRESKRIASKLFSNAQKKRDMSSVDVYDGVYSDCE